MRNSSKPSRWWFVALTVLCAMRARGAVVCFCEKGPSPRTASTISLMTRTNFSPSPAEALHSARIEHSCFHYIHSWQMMWKADTTLRHVYRPQFSRSVTGEFCDVATREVTFVIAVRPRKCSGISARILPGKDGQLRNLVNLQHSITFTASPPNEVSL